MVDEHKPWEVSKEKMLEIAKEFDAITPPSEEVGIEFEEALMREAQRELMNYLDDNDLLVHTSNPETCLSCQLQACLLGRQAHFKREVNDG